jgi:hypothetical protein
VCFVSGRASGQWASERVSGQAKSVDLEGLDVGSLFQTIMRDKCRRLGLLAVPDLVAWIGRAGLFGLCVSWATRGWFGERESLSLHRSTVTRDTRARWEM